MKLRPYILLLLFSLFGISTNAQQFQMTKNCLSAYQCFMAMKMEEGKKYLTDELLSNPTNRMPLLLINYEDYLTLLFNENTNEYKKRKALKDKRLSLLENSDKNSPYFLYAKAILHLQWSLIQIKYTNYWDAAWDFRKSHLLLKENIKKFPAFAFNNIHLGAQEAVISTIPKGYKWISSILGLKGDMKKGMESIKKFVASGQLPFREEALIYDVYLTNYIENDIKGAQQLITTYKLDTKNNQLFCFVAANIALNNKRADIAENLLTQRNKSAAYLPFPMLEYELGDAKMRRLDYTAIQHFQSYLDVSKSNFYLKDACLNIALCYYLQNNLKQAQIYKAKISQIGKEEADADKQAQTFSRNGTFPDKELLKARLLNDGGYNNQALTILLTQKPSNFKTTGEQLEYIYRLARVYDDLEQDAKALEYYKQTIQQGFSSTEYFAARAALQCGYIYEQMGNNQEALRYFNMLLEMGDHAFKNSLDQRAKAGINRIKSRY